MNFDMWYLMRRAEHLGAADFAYLGRIKNSQTRMRDAVFSSKVTLLLHLFVAFVGSHEFACEGGTPSSGRDQSVLG